MLFDCFCCFWVVFFSVVESAKIKELLYYSGSDHLSIKNRFPGLANIFWSCILLQAGASSWKFCCPSLECGNFVLYSLTGPFGCSGLATEIMWRRAFHPPFMTFFFLQKKLFAFLFLWSCGFEIQSFVSVGYMTIWYKNTIDFFELENENKGSSFWNMNFATF